MACCYIAASMIAFIIRGCDALDINLHIQYNESVEHGYDEVEEEYIGEKKREDVEASDATVVSISGMTCAACTSTVESALKEVTNVNEVFVSLPYQEARIFHSTKLNYKEVVSAIVAVGYDAEIGERASARKIATLRCTEELETLRNSVKGLSFFSAAIFASGTFLDYSRYASLLQSPTVQFSRDVMLFALTTIAAGRYGIWIFKNSGNAALHLRVNMHTLISASTVVGLSLTLLNMFHKNPRPDALYFDTILGVLLIITVGRYMDLLSRRRATDAFAGLYSLRDQTSTKRVLTSMVRSGDEILIEAFNIVPCDCYVVSGTSHVNEAVITGESLPKTKSEGDLLLAGSRNGPNQLHARINQDFERSYLSQLIRSVENSFSSKVSVQYRIDIITQYFVGAIFAIAIPTAVYTYVTQCDRGSDYVSWQKGILMLNGGETMERLKSITHIVMDKTGTLTRGTMTVGGIVVNGLWKDEGDKLATLICAAEEHGMAAHPLAVAIFRKFLPISGDMWKKLKDTGAARNFAQSGGRGVRCEVNTGDGLWRNVVLGNISWMKENNIRGIESLSIDVEKEGSAAFDVIRPDAKVTIDALKTHGVEISILTGDQPAEAWRISRELGIPVLDFAATPDVKLKHIKSIQARGGKVGDGMNDGPSLAAADVGVMIVNGRKCLTSGGSVLLLRPQLQSLITLLEISRTVMRQVSTNIAWVITYNVVAVALAMGLGKPLHVEISPPIAAAMMSVSSSFITVQGLLLRSRLAKEKEPDD
ncbi:HAD-like protein [Lindgomyces ingoldianus]|uniref:HAD-like protein n=1 Tax=Lindgomyces ingoldianus TaxID=673940 RepID=A0ACB6Q9N2_9PLEO|nr:HAD-like protein [Lindgomyces ingoldianus]KAF2462845.1 HAD-like protein [Lindgomyces ingoldianus]